MRILLALLLLLAAATLLPLRPVPIAAAEDRPVDTEADETDGSEPADPYAPRWGSAEAEQVIEHAYDADADEAANGEALRAAILRLRAGDTLRVAPGIYRIARKINLVEAGTPARPIRIVAATDPTAAADAPPVVITRPDARQNVLNIGADDGTRYAEYWHLRGLTFTGGSTGIRVMSGRHIWIDGCTIHHVAADGITVNTRAATGLFITGCTIHDTAQDASHTGEGMYIGKENRAVVTHSVIARNTVYNTRNGQQGDGIEIKDGCYGIRVAENTIHTTKYPCLILYGNGEGGAEHPNIVERNILWGSEDHTLQIQGDAIVRNNLILASAGASFYSRDHTSTSRRLTVVHNTIIGNQGHAPVQLRDWDGRPDMVFANNAVVSQTSVAIQLRTGIGENRFAGNALHGAFQIANENHAPSSSLGCFPINNARDPLATVFESLVADRFDPAEHDPTPTRRSPLVNAGDRDYAVTHDWAGTPRDRRPDVGAAER